MSPPLVAHLRWPTRTHTQGRKWISHPQKQGQPNSTLIVGVGKKGGGQEPLDNKDQIDTGRSREVGDAGPLLLWPPCPLNSTSRVKLYQFLFFFHSSAGCWGGKAPFVCLAPKKMMQQRNRHREPKHRDRGEGFQGKKYENKHAAWAP
jgi:uncharacterized protein (DUF779 family)